MATFTTHCKFCGKVYEAERSSSKFCSDSCRLKNSRQHPNAVYRDLEIFKATNAIDRLLNLSDEGLAEDAYLFAVLFERVEQLKARREKLIANIFGD